MATSEEYLTFVCEQIARFGAVRYRKMFGDVMVYLDDKPILLVCDNTVFVKCLPETAALLLILGAGIAIYILEVKYLPRIGLSLYDLHIAVEQNEDLFQGFETFVWIYIGAVGTALLLTIVFTNVNLTRELFTHISEPLDTLVGGVDRIRSGDLDSPINYTEPDEFKAACDAVDLMAAKLKASLEAEQRRQHQHQRNRQIHRQRRGRIDHNQSCDHEDITVGKVNQSQNTIDQRVADGNECVLTACGNAVDDIGEQPLHSFGTS